MLRRIIKKYNQTVTLVMFRYYMILTEVTLPGDIGQQITSPSIPDRRTNGTFTLDSDYTFHTKQLKFSNLYQTTTAAHVLYVFPRNFRKLHPVIFPGRKPRSVRNEVTEKDWQHLGSRRRRKSRHGLALFSAAFAFRCTFALLLSFLGRPSTSLLLNSDSSIHKHAERINFYNFVVQSVGTVLRAGANQ